MGDEYERRTFLKKAGIVAGTGALGSLAGCAGGDGESGNGGSGDGDGGSGDGGSGGSGSSGGSGGGGQETSTEPSQEETADGGGGQEAVTVTFQSYQAAESNTAKQFYEESMQNFESMNPNIKVDLQSAGLGDIFEKLPATVEAGNPPDLSISGTLGINFFLGDNVVDHQKYIESTEGLPDNWTAAADQTTKFRGEYWNGGPDKSSATLLCVRPKLFKEVGVDDPSTLETWTGLRQAVESIHQDSNIDAIPWEETGTVFDLESYWGEARTAYSEGTDPWVTGDYNNPNIKIGQNDRTDGMIKNCIEMGLEYSSSEVGSRPDEDLPSLMLTDRAASFPQGIGNDTRYVSIKNDATFGWDGDIYQQPLPRLDADYGEEFGISELEGLEGEHGGHIYEEPYQIFKGSDNPDAAWELLKYHNTSEEHVVPFVGDIYPSTACYSPLNQIVKQEYDLTQIHEAMIDAIENGGPNYNLTGLAWGLEQVDELRWNDLATTISESLAGQHSASETPGLIRERMQQTLQG